MSDNIHTLVEEHEAFYEVLPYYVVFEQDHEGLPPVTHRVQAGFEVDVYGVNRSKHLVAPGSDPDYELGYEALKRLADNVSQKATDSCCLEVAEFPSTVIFDAKRHDSAEAILQIIISHGRGLDKPCGPAEQRALDELEKELAGIGIKRGGKGRT